VHESFQFEPDNGLAKNRVIRFAPFWSRFEKRFASRSARLGSGLGGESQDDAINPRLLAV
jgi:hypothetical protein